HPFAHTLLLFPPYADHRDAHSFPTRRSSDLGIVDLDDLLQRLHVRKADIVEEAAAQESVGQFLFVVGSDDDDRAMRGTNCLARLVDVELHAVEFLEQVVRKLDIRLVDLVDEKHCLPLGSKCLPQFAASYVVSDVVEALVAKLAVAQARNGVIFVKALLGAGRGLDMPFDEVEPEGCGNLPRQFGLARAGLALDQQWPLKRDRRIDGNHQVLVGNIGRRTFETHGRILVCRARPYGARTWCARVRKFVQWRSQSQQSNWRTNGPEPILVTTVCASRQERLIPGASSIAKGAVPGRARGLGHMAPTYFVGSRDRLLHRLRGSSRRPFPTHSGLSSCS